MRAALGEAIGEEPEHIKTYQVMAMTLCYRNLSCGVSIPCPMLSYSQPIRIYGAGVYLCDYREVKNYYQDSRARCSMKSNIRRHHRD